MPPPTHTHSHLHSHTHTPHTHTHIYTHTHTGSQLVQVELPCDERTLIRVSPQTTISQLLRHICEKRNLEVADHRFDLPATEASLAGKTLEQLKITAIRVVMRGKLLFHS